MPSPVRRNEDQGPPGVTVARETKAFQEWPGGALLLNVLVAASR
jgi:hypothetical protein